MILFSLNNIADCSSVLQVYSNNWENVENACDVKNHRFKKGFFFIKQ